MNAAHTPNTGNDPFDPESALLNRRLEVLRLLSGLDQSFAEIVGAAEGSNLDDEHDPEGETVGMSRAMVTSSAASVRQHLNRIDAAVARVRAGTYGACLSCGGPISPPRLGALPEAELCMGCA